MQSVGWILATFSLSLVVLQGKGKRCKNYHLTNEDPFGKRLIITERPRRKYSRRNVGDRVKKAARGREAEAEKLLWPTCNKFEPFS